MAKAKQRQFLKTPANKMSSSNSPEVNQPGEDRWIMIKKQKVTILIPPLPVARESTVPNPEESQPLSRARGDIDQQSHCPTIIDSQVLPAAEFAQSMPSTAEKAIPCAPSLPLSPHIKTMPNLPRLEDRAMIEKRQDYGFTRGKIPGVFTASKASKQDRRFLNGDASLNPRMRALILERKFRRAGGLSSWLLSLGLDQFVKLFQGKRVGKYQLVNLTMKKLKDMGADAVGPRRKLMHAIDCLCQPYCFEIGSTEWVEQNLVNLGAKAIAYLNVDCAVQGPGFFASATPQLDDLLVEVTKKVRDPDLPDMTLFEDWTSPNQGLLVQMLSRVDSDFAPFLQQAGVPSIDLY